jgi:anti-sigma-K factor RskA
MSESGHERWEDDVAAYLLGALEPGEAADLERHVAGCADCQAQLRRLRPAVDLLPESVERVDPPAGLRERIFEQARSEARRPVPRPEPKRRRRRVGWRPLAQMGAAVALISAAVAGYAIRGGGSGEGGATTVVGGSPPGVTAKVVREGDSGVLRLANVRRLPSDRVLEAWVQRDGDVTPVRGLFVPDRDGRATTVLPNMRGVEAVMVTAEPRGGSEVPTSVPMVTVTMPE